MYMYLLFFGFPSHLGHHRAPGRVPLATISNIHLATRKCLCCVIILFSWYHCPTG